MASLPLILVACLFALVSGANDGAALLSTNLASKAVPPLAALLILVAAIVVGPFVLGTAVASTLVTGLVSFEGAGGDEALLIAVAIAIVLIAALTRFGIPTSVTQALTGAIIGVGIGRGLPVDLAVVAKVLLILVAAPIVAGALGWVAALALGRIRPSRGVRTQVRVLQAIGWLAQSAAYAANDSQKMVAVFAVALGLVAGRAPVAWSTQLAIGVLFFVGTLAGASRLGGRIGKLLPITPMAAVGAGYGSAVAVIGSAAVGAPVSMSQATASALVGAESVVGSYRRVRWEEAVRIVSTWLTTFPTALALAAVLGLATRR